MRRLIYQTAILADFQDIGVPNLDKRNAHFGQLKFKHDNVVASQTAILTACLDDIENGDLIHTDDDEKADEDGYSIIAMWNWERQNYYIKD